MARQTAAPSFFGATWETPERVTIYAWHWRPGESIQPLSPVHGARCYADQSQGVRLVSAVAFVDGQARPMIDTLEDLSFARIPTDERPIIRLAKLMNHQIRILEKADQGNECTMNVAR